MSWVAACCSLQAQVSELVATDAAGGALPGNIGSLELYETGLFWTVYGGRCSGEFATLPSLAILGFRNRPFSQKHYAVLGCPPTAVGGAARDETFVFFTTPEGVWRKPAGADHNEAARTVGPEWGDLVPGAAMILNGRVYYAYSSETPLSSQGYFGIEYFQLPGGGGRFQPVFEVANGAGLPNVGRLKKLGVVQRRFPGGGAENLASYGLALTEQGHLLRFNVEQTLPQFRPAAIIASEVTDFAVRREEFLDPDPFRLSYFEDQLYVSLGTARCPSDPAGRIVTLDPISGATSTVFTAPDGYIAAIGLDQEYLFASTYGRRQLGGPFGGCELVPPGVIRSKRHPARLFAGGGGTDPNWQAIELSFAGENLRSDGQWLYFTRGKEVRRLRNNSPPARQNLAALGLEAVQVIQDLNNSVRLIEGKRTIVRAYAAVTESSSIQTDWFPPAQLRGWRDGVELPGPLFSLGNTRINRERDLAKLRPWTELSYQFELPPEWVRRGRLTLRFTVNPNLATPEFIGGADPLADNSVTAANLSVVQVRPPCWVFASIHSTTAPNYWPWEHPAAFAETLERAKALLPVPDLHLHLTTERISDERVCLQTCSVLGVPVPCGFICNEPFDLSRKEDWDEALAELAAYDSFDQNRPGCGRTHYVGAVHPATRDVAAGGIGELPGTRFMAFMHPGEFRPENSPWAGRTLAHEFGHNLNRRHVDQTLSARMCGSSKPDGADPSYPYDPCTLGTNSLASASTPLGFDVLTFRPVLPDRAADLMSYAPNRWPSVWTYNAMLDALGPAGPALAGPAPQPGPPPPGPYLLVRGLVHQSRATVRLKGCFEVPEGVVDPAKVLESLAAATLPAGHGYEIHKLDAGGNTLETVPLVLQAVDDGDETTALVHQFVTRPAGMAALEVRRHGAVLARLAASAHAPEVLDVSAVFDPLGPGLQIRYVARDADTDPLRFVVQFSADDGATWRTLRVNEGAQTFTANPRFLPGGERCRVRILASDGFLSGVGVSEPFALPRRAPEVFLTGVRAGQRLPLGSLDRLRGLALDAEDGSLPADALRWQLDGPTPRTATGAELALADLSPGAYTATLSASDSDGLGATNTVTFEVQPLIVPETPAPVVDGEVADAAWAAAPTSTFPQSPRSTVRLVHAGGALYVAFSDLPYGTAGAPARVGLFVDMNATGADTPGAAHVGYLVDENGLPAQLEGNGARMQPRTNPAAGFQAVIYRGPGGWNAEFRLPDDLVGGWNRAVRLGFWQELAAPGGTQAAGWPVLFNPDLPASWAPAWFGPALPAAENLAPVAVAAAPRQLDAQGPTRVALDGSASFDPEGAPLTYTWTQLAGPAVLLDNATGSTAGFVAEVDTPTRFRFQLEVHDGERTGAPAAVELELVPQTPQPVSLPPPATRHEDGSVTVRLSWPGYAGTPVTVQVSTNLVDWEELETRLVGPLEQLVYTDARAGLYPLRFYRLSAVSPGEPLPEAGTALQFDGTGSRVEVPHDPAFNAFPLTVTFWLNTANATPEIRGLVSKYAESSLNGYSLFLIQGRLHAWYFRNAANYIWDGGLGLDAGFVADGQWHHIALVVDAAGARLYVDGTRRAARAWQGTPGAGTSPEPLQFGRYAHYTTGLDGRLDEIALWNRALSEAELHQLVPGTLRGDEAGLIGYWPLDEGAGSVTADATGTGRAGALVQSPVWVSSTAPLTPNPAAGQALRFDGVDDAVRVAHAPELNAFPLTVAAWVKTTQVSPGYVALANKYPGGSGNGYSLHLHNGRVAAFYFRGDGASWVYAADPGLDGGFIADGRWHHVAFVVDAAGGRLFVDAVQTASLGWTGTAGPCTTTAPLLLGTYPLAGQILSLDGRLDEVALWSRALAPEEVRAAMQFKVHTAHPGLVGYWPLDEGAGDVARDATGRGHVGALLEGPVWVTSDAPMFP